MRVEQKYITIDLGLAKTKIMLLVRHKDYKQSILHGIFIIIIYDIDWENCYLYVTYKPLSNAQQPMDRFYEYQLHIAYNIPWPITSFSVYSCILNVGGIEKTGEPVDKAIDGLRLLYLHYTSDILSIGY